MSRHYVVQPSWHVTVIDEDGTTMLEHHRCEDRREAVSVATEMRTKHWRAKIWLRSPFDELSNWD